jgi:uncharacterized phiE125 gp8 family phage protein
MLVTPPVDEPVSADMVIRHGKLQVGLDTDILSLRITAARQLVEAYTGRAFMRQTWAYALDDWDHEGVILLPKSPVLEINSVTSYDSLHVPTVMSTAGYRLDTGTLPSRVLLNDGYLWGGDRYYGGLTIEYDAGYGDHEDAVPAVAKQAIILLVTQWSTYLEAASDLDLNEMPYGVRELLSSLVVYA